MLWNFNGYQTERSRKYLSCDEQEILNEIENINQTEKELQEWERRFAYAALCKSKLF